MRFLNMIVKDESGATAIEYGLIAGLICVAIMGGLSYFGTQSVGMLNRVSTSISEVL